MEEALRTALKNAPAVAALVGDRVDWGLGQQGAARPSIRLTLISRNRDTTYSGRSGLVESRVQVDCFADTFAAAKALSRAVVGLSDTLWPSPFKGVVVAAERDDTEDAEPDPIHRTSLDLMVWHAEP